jgi:hypothetical protein
MYTVIDTATLFTPNREPLPGSAEAARQIAEHDRLLYITAESTDLPSGALRRSNFPAAPIIACNSDSEKLLAILQYIHPNERITFISTEAVLRALDIDRVWMNHPQAARTLASRFTFIIHGVERITRDILPHAEFPIEAQLVWQPVAVHDYQ